MRIEIRYPMPVTWSFCAGGVSIGHVLGKPGVSRARSGAARGEEEPAHRRSGRERPWRGVFSGGCRRVVAGSVEARRSWLLLGIYKFCQGLILGRELLEGVRRCRCTRGRPAVSARSGLSRGRGG